MNIESIINAIDNLPAVDQETLIGAIVPGADGTYDRYGSAARYARLHRMADTFGQLRSDIAEEAVVDMMEDGERLYAELRACYGDELTDFAVRLILDLPHDAPVTRALLTRAASSLIGEALDRPLRGASRLRADASVAPDDLAAHVVDAVDDLERHFERLFEWDGNYENIEQVRPYMPAFLRAYDEVKVRDGLAYNDDFVGKVDGLAGSPHEETGIYLLQNLRRRDEYDAKIAAMLDDGYREWSLPDTAASQPGSVLGRFPDVAVCDGSSVRVYADARIVFVDKYASGVRLAIMRPRQRTRGEAVPSGAVILVRGDAK